MGGGVQASLMAFLRECGCEMSKPIFKSDQETAILTLVEDLVKRRVDKGSGETIPKNSPAYRHQSNGVVERGIQSVEGMIRAMRSAFEERITGKSEIELHVAMDSEVFQLSPKPARGGKRREDG